MSDKPSILIVDDDRVSREMLAEVLGRAGYPTETADSAEAALGVVRARFAPIVLSDIRMLKLTGLDLLREVKRVSPATVVVLMTGFGSLEGALEAIREGAFDYLSKPFRMDELKAVVARAAKQTENQRTEPAAAPDRPAHQGMLGRSPRIVEVYKLMARAALSSSAVLVTGEAGTGKALIAKTIHENSARKNGPFVTVGAEELESGAVEAKLRQAAGGTVLVEDLASLTPMQQTRLTRAQDLAQREGLDLRWMALSRVTLRELQAGRVREDLLYPLSVVVIEIPPLRDRREDLPEMVSAYLAKYNERNGKSVSHVSARAMQVLQAYGWPGNVRELERVVDRAVTLSSTSVLEAEDFDELFAGASAAEPGAAPAVVNLEEVERRHIVEALRSLAYNKSKAAEALGIDRATLYRKARLYGIDLKGARPKPG